MERALLYLLALVLWSQPLAAVEVDAAWHQVKQRDGVTVYIREVAGSPLAESLAVMQLDATLAATTALILDVANNYRWIDSVDQSRVIERISATESINYTVSKAPWPVSDRDAVVHTRVVQDPHSLAVLIRSEALPEYLPRVAGMVRVEAIASSWQLLPQPDGGVEVRYQVHSDPGGKLPRWLVNAVATEQPLNTLHNMRQAVKVPAYAGAELPFLRQPRQ